MPSKSIFSDHGEALNKEHEELETYQEKTTVVEERCMHKDLEIVGHELRCKCGACWSGTALEIQEAYEFLKNQK